jgi:homoserine dehydrogenase
MNELASLANKKKIYIFPEASLGGGIPIINSLQRDLLANRIKSVIGIMSGTSNYILSEMTKRGISLKKTLTLPQIQQLGESISIIDYEGSDAAQKVSIIAAAAFGIEINYLHIHAEGLSDIDDSDIRYADEFGYEFKLLAILRDHEDKFEIRVHPTLIPKDHPLTAVRSEYNAFLIETDLLGDYIIYGKGVGIEATSSLLIRDVVGLANLIYDAPRMDPYRLDWNDKPVMPMDEIISSFYIRFPCHDRPGVIGKITSVLGKFKINIGSAHAEVDMQSPMQMGFVHVLVDHAKEKDVQKAMQEISNLDLMRDKIKYYRIL